MDNGATGCMGRRPKFVEADDTRGPIDWIAPIVADVGPGGNWPPTRENRTSWLNWNHKHGAHYCCPD